MIVAGKGRGHQVFHPILDPFHRLTGHNGGDDGTNITRVDTNLIAKAAANIGGDHANIVLFDSRQQRGHGAHHMWRLEGAPKRQLAVDLVHRGHRAAGLQRAGVGAVVIHGFLSHHLGIVQHLIGACLIALFPGEDMVVVFARPMGAFGLALQILAQNHIGFQCLKGIGDHW